MKNMIDIGNGYYVCAEEIKYIFDSTSIVMKKKRIEWKEKGSDTEKNIKA